tara:strand:- start:33039 stop:33362 length:324 start_codon:yes stop_codon:yes gene_type:complete
MLIKKYIYCSPATHRKPKLMNILIILSASLILSIASPLASPSHSFENYYPPKDNIFSTTINHVDDYFSIPTFMRELNTTREEPSMEKVLKRLHIYGKKNHLFENLSK